jgi:hypothetical protein
MKIIELTIRRNGRVTSREACRPQNEGKTLTGRYPTRQAELEAAGYTVERRVVNGWPKWWVR